MTAPAPSPRDPLRPTEAEIQAATDTMMRQSIAFTMPIGVAAGLRAAYALALPRLIRAVVDAIPYTAFERDNVSRALLFDDRPDLINELLTAAMRIRALREAPRG